MIDTLEALARRTTMGADGYPRRKFTVDDCIKMVERGVISHEERFELLDGEIFPKNADPADPKVVMGADGFARRRFTVAEVWALIENEIIHPDEQFELIDGEFIPTSPKNHRHERTKNFLTRALSKAIDDSLFVAVESTLYLTDSTFVEPDLLVVPERLRVDEVQGKDVLLAIEIADTSLRYDRDNKAPRYARSGIPLFWLVDVNARTVTAYSQPGDGLWTLTRIHRADEPLTVPALPGFSFRLAYAD